MNTLFTSLSARSFARYRLGNVSNLERLAKFNQTRMEERSQWFQSKLPNEHPLVQLLIMMGIDSSMTQQELIDRINLKRERWFSWVNPVSIYRKGKLHTNLVTMDGIHDLLISLPDQLEITDYFIIPEKDICPFIPIYSESLDYDFRLIQDKPSSKPKNQIGIIGIDIAALAIGYWRHLQKQTEGMTSRNFQPYVWLTGYPLLNAQLLSNRLFFINYLYEKVVMGKEVKVNLPDTPSTLNNISQNLTRYLDNLEGLLEVTPIRHLEALFQTFPNMDTLDTDPLNPNYWKDPGKYELYQQTRWVFDFHYMKVLTVLFYYNNLTSVNNGHLNAAVVKWLRRDTRLAVNHMTDPLLVNRYTQLRDKLNTLV